MENMYEILSDNLVRLRKSRNLTQAEFAEIIKYSDKSVSKWETGMSVPSLETLLQISDFYGMTIDDLIRKPVDYEKVETVEKRKKANKLVISLLSVAAVWLLATVIFTFSVVQGNNYWNIYIWALPTSCILGIIFSSIWNRRPLFVILSILNWTFITALFLELNQRIGNSRFWMLFIVGIPIQVIIILCRSLKRDVLDDNGEGRDINIKKRMEKQKLKKQLEELNQDEEEKSE